MKKNEKGFSAIEVVLVVVVVGLIGAVGWLIYDRQYGKDASIASPVSTESQVEESTETKTEEPTYKGQKVTSGLGRFTIEIPQGWNEMLRPMDSDWLLMKEGTTQPKHIVGQKVTVTDLPSFGGDGPRVFSMLVYNNFAAPEGTPADFTLPNDGKPIQGKKYTKTYTVTTSGLGGREKGEKSYEYRFSLNDGNLLVVSYSVYNDDLNDQNALIDEVVKSIIIKN